MPASRSTVSDVMTHTAVAVGRENGLPDVQLLGANAVRCNLFVVIDMTAEAARCGWIARRIDQSIAYGGDSTGPGRSAHMGSFGLQLETH
ncbi:hypothetical protein ABT213_19160 [Streptomyces sp. NPDC001674]|uniref:hypothetical protein n=1 Tax=Streptomyces sp. NPDC001674 TaxID=3154394 RepID=UPI003318D3D6